MYKMYKTVAYLVAFRRRYTGLGAKTERPN